MVCTGHASLLRAYVGVVLPSPKYAVEYSQNLNKHGTNRIVPRFMASKSSEGPAKVTSKWKIFGGAITVSVVVSSLYAYWKIKKQQATVEK